MRTLYRLFWIAAFSAAMIATSCGETTTDVDDNNNGGTIVPNNPTKPEEPNNNPSARKISKITRSDEDGTNIYTFDYDTQGRVNKMTFAYDDYSYCQEYELRYYDDELNLFYSWYDDYGEEGSAYYFFIPLNNSGYIAEIAVEEEGDSYYENYVQTFEYNMQGYIKGFEYTSYYNEDGEEYIYSWGTTYKWSNGNITSREEYNEGEDYFKRWTMTYNNKKLEIVNLDINSIVEYYNYDLYAMGLSDGLPLAIGLVGKTNKNFITKSVGESSEYEEHEITYKWSYDEDGYPIHCLVEGYSYDEIRYTFDFEYLTNEIFV